MNEFSEAERFSAYADAGFEGFEAVGEGWVGVEEGRSEDEFCGVARNLEELVYAVSLGEIGFEVVKEVSVVGFGCCWWWFGVKILVRMWWWW